MAEVPIDLDGDKAPAPEEGQAPEAVASPEAQAAITLAGLNRNPTIYPESVEVFNELFVLLSEGYVTANQFAEFTAVDPIAHSPSLARTMIIMGAMNRDQPASLASSYLFLKGGHESATDIQYFLADLHQPINSLCYRLENLFLNDKRDNIFEQQLTYLCSSLAKRLGAVNFFDHLLTTIMVVYDHKKLPMMSTKKGQIDDLIGIIESKLASLKFGPLAEYQTGDFTRLYQQNYRDKKGKNVIASILAPIVESLGPNLELQSRTAISIPAYQKLKDGVRPNLVLKCIRQLERHIDDTTRENVADQRARHLKDLRDVIDGVDSVEKLMPALSDYTQLFAPPKGDPAAATETQRTIWKLVSEKFKSLIKNPDELVVAYMRNLRDIKFFPHHAATFIREEAVRQRGAFSQRLIDLEPPASFSLALMHLDSRASGQGAIFETLQNLLFAPNLTIAQRNKYIIQSGILINSIQPSATAINAFKKAMLKAQDLDSNAESYYAYITQVLIFANQEPAVINTVLAEVKGQVTSNRRKAEKAEAEASARAIEQAARETRQALERERLAAERERAAAERAAADRTATSSDTQSDSPSGSVESTKASDGPKLTLNDFNQIIRAHLEANQDLANLERSSVSLKSFPPALTDIALEVFLDDEKLAAFPLDTPRLVPVEEGSPLAFFGVTHVSFTQRNDHFDFACVFGNERFLNGFHLDAQKFDFTSPAEIFKTYPWLEPIFTTEVLRHFAELNGLGKEDLSLEQVRILLGLDQFVIILPPRAAMLDQLQGGQAEGPQQGPAESPETINTRSFTAENYDSFLELYLALAEAGVARAVPESFEDLKDDFEELRYSTTVSTTISPLGLEYPRSEIPEGHPLKPYIKSIYLSNVPQSEAVIKGLEIRPELLYVDISDSNLVYVHVELPDGREVTVHACVIPPRYEVYILGVGEETYLNNEAKDKVFIMFQHLILQAYHSAVACDYDTSRRSASGRKHGTGGGAWESKIRTLVDEITKRELPVLVVLNPRKPTDQSNDPGEPRKSGPKLRPRSRQEKIDEIFKRLSCASNPPATLAAHGLLLRGSDYLSAHYANDARGVFPREAWDATGHLKKEYEKIYVPVDSQEKVAEVLYGLAHNRLYTPTTDPEDAIFYFNQAIEDGIPAAEAFQQLLVTGPLKAGDPNFAFHMKARALFRSHEDTGIINFKQIYEYIEEQAGELGLDVTPEKIVRALFTLSTFDLRDLNIATSGATEIRFPYLPSTTDLPDDFIFTKEGYETDPDIDLDIIKVIAGNRARIVENGLAGIRGNNRSDALNFAAQVQTRFRNPALGSEVNLAPRARALLVWEFADGGPAAYTLLDTARSKIKPKPISGAETLRSAPVVNRAAQKAKSENHSGVHTDFSNVQDWSTQELRRLAELGVLTLGTDEHGKTTITSSRPVARKRIVIFEEEQVGYKQLASDPVNFEEYLAFLHRQGEPIPAGIEFDPELAKIQYIFRDLLAA